jgi:hypothetical protein
MHARQTAFHMYDAAILLMNVVLSVAACAWWPWSGLWLAVAKLRHRVSLLGSDSLINTNLVAMLAAADALHASAGQLQPATRSVNSSMMRRVLHTVFCC